MTQSAPCQDVSDQQTVLDFLGVAPGETDVRRIDTHASIVFLMPNHVFKIKRAVRLPFLDYSSLAKRKHACEEEIAVNRRYAPDLYHRVVPITEWPDGPEIDGKGNVIEWAVEMTRFDERQTLDHLAVDGKITAELADRLADTLCKTHRDAPTAEGAEWLASLPGIIDRNTQTFRNFPILRAADVEFLHARSTNQLARCRPLLQQRAASGEVRRCHGDAHLGNIVLIGGSPVLFDAIEFDPVIATTDILYDLSFPLMDLLHFERIAPANRLLNGYLRSTWHANAEGLSLLPLFLSIRAAIRANVLFTKHAQDARDAAVLSDAKSYFELALRLIAPEKPSLIAIGGRSGTGKSVLARAMAELIRPIPGAVLLRSDIIRKEILGVGELVKLPEATYTLEMSQRVYRLMIERARIILSQGLSVVVDAAFLKEEERRLVRLLADSCRVEFSGIFLVADPAVRLERIASRRNDASDATADVVRFQENIDIGQLDWEAVDASGTPEQTLQRSLRHLPLNALLAPSIRSAAS